MPATEQASATARPAPPISTWVLMGCSLVAALFLLDWRGTGVAKHYGFFAVPSVLGLAGAGFALHSRRGGWALTSGLWGVVMVPALVVAVTVLAGP